MEFLENYKWSSFPDYIGKKNFPSVTQREFMLDFWGNEGGYKKEVENWFNNQTTGNNGDMLHGLQGLSHEILFEENEK